MTSFGYDNANRLVDLHNLTGGSGSIIASYHFTLDGNGNRIHSSQTTPLTPAQDNGSIDLSFNAKKNRLLAANDVTYTYDDEGQLASAYGNTYTFDYEHRLTGISGTSISEQFRYDGAGNRLEVVRNGVVSRYVYDLNGNLIAEADANNVITRYYIHGKGLLAMATPAGALYCYHFDATGHTVALTNSSKNIVNKYAYTPHGLIASQVEAVPQPFKFVGQYGVMAETDGFYYMRARYYDPEVGRFISEDPLGFDGGDVNLYAYAGNNPVMLVDPLGLEWQASLGVSGTIGGLPPPFSLGPSGFIGGGVNVGITSSGQLFVQFQANAVVGLGTYGGVGGVANVGHSPSSTSAGISTQTSRYAETNAGWGYSGGGGNATFGNGIIGGGRSLRGGVGYGAMVGGGQSTTTTIATPALW